MGRLPRHRHGQLDDAAPDFYDIAGIGCPDRHLDVGPAVLIGLLLFADVDGFRQRNVGELMEPRE